VRETPSAATTRAAEPLIAEDIATSEKLVDLRFKLKSVLTADEWARVLPTRAAAATTGKKGN
jgi:hypothetical protein